MFVAIITGLSVIFAGWASIAAESSVPWEILYPIKIHVNESVQSAFAVSAESEAKLQLSFIEERFKEKSELRAEWKLTAELESDIEMKIKAHWERFQKETETMKNSNQWESATTLEVKFSTILSSYNTTNSNSTTESKTTVKAESNTSADIDWFIDDIFDSSTEVKTEAKSEIDAWIESSNEFITDVEAKVDSSIDTAIDVVNDVNIQSDTSVSNSTSWSSNIQETTVDTTTDAQSSNSVDVGDTSTTADSATSVTGNGWLGIR